MSENSSDAQEVDWDEVKPQMIKLGLELGPLILFFLINAQGEKILGGFPWLKNLFPESIFLATGVFMVAMIVSLILSWMILKKIAVMPLVTGVIVLVFGGLTIYLQNDIFIKMKPTIVNVLFGAILLGGLLFGQSLLKYVFGEVYRLQPKGWWILTVRWGMFFFFLALLNEIVWRNFTTDQWVAFKVWGIMPITIVFSLFQMKLLNEYAPEEAEER